LYFRVFNTNVAIFVGSKKPVKETEIQVVAETLHPKQTTDSSKQLFQGDYFEQGTQFKITNGWKVEFEDKTLVVEAGCLTTDPKQGIIFVKTLSNSGEELSQKQYNTPAKRGPVTITDYNGFNLTIMAADGYKWIFNPYDGFRMIPQ